jgi:CHASE2 domain-containing sensor protein
MTEFSIWRVTDVLRPKCVAVKKTFVSYRRDDSIVYADRIYKALADDFGKDNVFFDLENIDYGDDFKRAIDEKVGSCDVLVAVMGAQWTNIGDSEGRRRLDNPNDYVRYEIAMALRRGRGIKVIPVLVGGARMPRTDQLPDELAALTTLNALEIIDRRIQQDLQRLIEAVRGRSFRDTLRELIDDLRLRRLSQWIGLGALLFMLFAAWVALFDYFTLDTKVASYTIWLGDLFARKAFRSDIALVAIDEDTERHLNKSFERNRSWRREHAHLIDQLSRAGAKAIVFDLFFQEPSPDDALLLGAIAHAQQRGTSVVVGAADLAGDRPEMISGLREAASGWGIVCVGRKLGYATAVPLAIARERRGVPSLALVAAYLGEAVLRVDQDTRTVILHDSSTGKTDEVQFAVSEQVTSAQSCQALTPGDTVAMLMIDLSPLPLLRSASTRFAYEQILEASVQELLGFAGKIVLVGVEVRGKDVSPVFRGLTREERFGLELHADAVNTLLNGTVIRPLGAGGQFVIMLGLAFLGGRLWLWKLGGWRFLRPALVSAAILTYLAVSIYTYIEYRVLLNALYHLGAFGITYWATGKAERRISG